MRTLLFACVASVALPAAADTVLSFDTTDQQTASTVRMVDGAVRIDGQQAAEWMLYQADENALFIVSPRDRS